jgi:uncharacterized protein YceH (UPF0502 family)
MVTTGGGNRVPKFSHRLQDNLNLGRREVALLCELLLRGPQTPGELKDRAGRMQRLTDLEEVEACLRTMMEYPEGPLVTKLPRQTGMKEGRYAHLISGDVVVPEQQAEAPISRAGSSYRIAALEAELGELRVRMQDLEREWSDFRRQFE